MNRLTFVAALLVALAVTGCRDSSSSPAVGVGAHDISVGTVERHVDSYARTSGVRSPERCDDQSRCDPARRALLSHVINELLRGAWWAAEADRTHIDVPAAEIAAHERRIRRGLPSGHPLTGTDIRQRARFDAARELVLGTLAARRAPKPGRAAARAYYDGHRQQFAVPSSRDLLLLVARSRADARTARAQLNRGVPFSRVHRRFNDQRTAAAPGGVLRNTARAALPSDLAARVFRARAGTFRGPLRTQAGWVIFRVTAKHHGRPAPSFELIAEQVTAMLHAARRHAARRAIEAAVQRHWRPRSRCAKRYTVTPCPNATPLTATDPPPGQRG